MFKIVSQIYVLNGSYKMQDLTAFTGLNIYSIKYFYKFGAIVQWPTLFQGTEAVETQSAEEGNATLGTKYHSVHKWPFSSFLLNLKEKKHQIISWKYRKKVLLS